MQLAIETDTNALIAALGRLGPAVERFAKAAAKVTAERIVVEARARVARRTGRTAAGITAEEARDGQGYVVHPWSAEAGNDQQPANLPLWLEFGTETMAARPYFFVSADLERGPHDRRLRQAIRDAIDEASQ